MLRRCIMWFLCTFLILTSFSYSLDSDLYVSLRQVNEPVLPVNFRLAKDPFVIPVEPIPSRTGLEELNISGSGAFSEESLKEMVKNIPSQKKILILDLIGEPHAIANGIAICWKPIHNNPRYSGIEGKSEAEIEAGEARLLENLKRDNVVVLNPLNAPLWLVIQQVETECQMVNRLGLDYMRFHIKDFHPPTNQQIERFISLVKNLTPDTWLHIHCAGGLGRTTTFMILYDMMHHAEKFDADVFIHRHRALGGQNLFNLHDKPDSSEPWKEKPAKARLELLRTFHQYCKESNHLTISWTEWLSLQDTQ